MLHATSIRTSFMEVENRQVATTTIAGMERYLRSALSELGTVESVKQHSFGKTGIIRDGTWNVHLTLREPAAEVGWSIDALRVNTCTGGCMEFRARFHDRSWEEAVKNGRCHLQFDLSLSSDVVPLEDHNEQTVRAEIDSFVEKLRRGIAILRL